MKFKTDVLNKLEQRLCDYNCDGRWCSECHWHDVAFGCLQSEMIGIIREIRKCGTTYVEIKGVKNEKG